jgi:hypothetical protein
VKQDRARAIDCYRHAAAAGDKSAEGEVRWLVDSTNCVGFISEEERSTVIQRLPRSSELWGDMGSAGLLFRNAAERMKWALGLQKRVAEDEAEIDRLSNSWFRHYSETERYVREGYSRPDAERKAGW